MRHCLWFVNSVCWCILKAPGLHKEHVWLNTLLQVKCSHRELPSSKMYYQRLYETCQKWHLHSHQTSCRQQPQIIDCTCTGLLRWLNDMHQGSNSHDCCGSLSTVGKWLVTRNCYALKKLMALSAAGHTVGWQVCSKLLICHWGEWLLWKLCIPLCGRHVHSDTVMNMFGWQWVMHYYAMDDM